MSQTRTYIEEEIRESIAVKTALLQETSERIVEAASLIQDRLDAGGKLVVFGNGGSAADAQHLAAELVGRYRQDRKAIAAISLTTDSSALTSISNDYGFDTVFSRQLEAIAKPGDIVLAISTSGNSSNVIRAVALAKKLGIPSIGLTGRSGGKLLTLVDVCLQVPSDSTPRIQEAHSLIIHIISGIVENAAINDSRSAGTEEMSAASNNKDAA
jgi:D-sedoheptulose 7-phosphate isomerase